MPALFLRLWGGLFMLMPNIRYFRNRPPTVSIYSERHLMHTNLFKNIRLVLQYFAGEGASAGGDGAGDGASAGVNAAVAGQGKSLEDLGVPKAKAERYRARQAKSAPTKQVEPASSAAETAPAAATPESSPDEDAWEKAKKDPVINKKMQETVNARLNAYAKKNGDAQAKLDALAPALELIGKKVGIDASDLGTLDINKFAEAVNADPSYYEDMAAEMGVDTQTARQIHERERAAQQQEAAAKKAQQEALFRKHFDGMKENVAKAKQSGFNIDLQKELEDPVFRDRTSPKPSQGITPQEAYILKNFDNILQTRINEAVRSTQTQISNRLRSQRGMPAENGTVERSGTATQTKSYADMNQAERAAYYKQMTGREQKRRKY